MPKRDWRNGLAIGLTVGICLATLLYVYASFFYGEISCRQYDQGGNAQSSYNEGQQEECNVPQWWSATQSLVKSEDTLAQWIMAVLSVIAAAVSAWAVFLVRDSLRATNLALDEAKTANSLAREIGQAQVRAYLSIAKISMAFDENLNHPTMVISIKNAGQSPAMKIEIVIEFSFFQAVKQVMPDPIENQIGVMWLSDIPSGSEVLSHGTTLTDVRVSTEILGRNLVDLWGVHIDIIIYAYDVFGGEITAGGHFSTGWAVGEARTEQKDMLDFSMFFPVEHFVERLRRPHRSKNRVR